MDGELLVTFLLVLALATAVLLLFHRLRLPPLLGFLLTGILVGPHGLGLVHTLATVEVVAEAGVVLLLFTIGLEFSFQRLRRIQRTLLTVGTTQVVVTVLAVLAVARASGQPLARSVFLGLLVALSSTVVVLRLLQEKYELDTQHGGIALAVLIFQDLAVVPMLLVTPLLGGRGDGAGAAGELLLLLGKAAAIIALVVVAARFVVPRLFYLIARTRSSELFSLSILVTCFAVAGLTSWLGLSLALGAFLAGLTLSDSEYGHQAFASMVPFRDVFASFFFISIGMLLDPGFVLRHPLAVLTACAVVLGIKVLVAGGAVQLFGHSLRNAVLVGFSLAQIGEFSFILAQEGLAHGLLAASTYQLFLVASVLTMGATPLLLFLAPRLVDLLLRLPVPARLKVGLQEPRRGPGAAA
ncbi:MAG: potassium transporter KefB, partial [Deltaproteobacteria bacterium]|nr:potassium transporter KefB [Deltaproteobacteria bacterium]